VQSVVSVVIFTAGFLHTELLLASGAWIFDVGCISCFSYVF